MNMSYSNENTEKYIEKVLSNKELYDEFIATIYEMFNDDDEKYKSVNNLIRQYKANKELREGIDLAFIALTGYSLGSLIELNLDDNEKLA